MHCACFGHCGHCPRWLLMDLCYSRGDRLTSWTQIRRSFESIHKLQAISKRNTHTHNTFSDQFGRFGMMINGVVDFFLFKQIFSNGIHRIAAPTEMVIETKAQKQEDEMRKGSWKNAPHPNKFTIMAYASYPPAVSPVCVRESRISMTKNADDFWCIGGCFGVLSMLVRSPNTHFVQYTMWLSAYKAKSHLDNLQR